MTFEGLIGMENSAALYLMNTEFVVSAEDDERDPIIKRYLSPCCHYLWLRKDPMKRLQNEETNIKVLVLNHARISILLGFK
jgi:hypothetical protein